jgi:hypothetical protein
MGIFVGVVVAFHLCYGLQILIPTNVSWLMTAMHDWGTHYLGWYFYRNEAWQFPLGQVSNYFHPLGTNVGYTDSIPLLALFFKVFAGILPEDFQYFGIWLLVCHLLAAYCTYRLCGLLGLGPLPTFLAALFVVTNPVLIFRGMHPALCAHWLLIAGIYLYLLNPKTVAVSRILLYQALLLLISALLNPYLCFMVLGCSFIIALKLSFFDKALKTAHFFAYLGASVVGLLAVWYVVGMITVGKKEEFAVEGAYGLYSLNLNALYNASGFSKLLPSLKQVSWHQYEGYMYLGAGIILLLFASVALLVYRRFVPARRSAPEQSNDYFFNGATLTPMLLLGLLYTLFSLTHVVSVNDQVLFKIPAPSLVVQLGNIFRASARFFWLPYYLIFLAAIIIVAKSRLKPPVRTALLAAALVIQLYDTQSLLTGRKLTYGDYTPPVTQQRWSTLMAQFDEVILYPPFQSHYLTTYDYQFFSFLAAKARKPINLGYVARVDYNGVQRVTDELNAQLVEDHISPGKLYITTAEHLKNFSHVLRTGAARLNTLDNYYYLFSNEVTAGPVLNVSNAANRGHERKLDSVLVTLRKQNQQFREVSKLTAFQNGAIHFNLDLFTDHHKYISAGGWAYAVGTEDNRGDSIFLYLDSFEKSYLSPTTFTPRPDVTESLKKPNLSDVGFHAFVLKQGIDKGGYNLGVAIKSKAGKWTYEPTDKFVRIGPEFATVTAGAATIPVRDILWAIDVLETKDNFVRIAGWSFFKGQGTEDTQIQLVMQNGGKTFMCETIRIMRPDVTTAWAINGTNLDYSGFDTKIAKSAIPRGTYRLGIHIKNLKTRTEGMVLTDRTVSM